MSDPQTATPSIAKIVRFHQLGGPEVLQVEDLPLPTPGTGEVRLRVKAIGLNRAECLFRKGQYLDKPTLPSGLGYEASGIVEAVGPDVDAALVGHVRSTVPAFPMSKYGVYGEVAIVPARALAAYPEALSFAEGTSIWMQYLTAWGALCHIGKMTAGDFVVIPAASSSVGLAAIEIARAEGATAIALTRSSDKRQALLDFGAHHVIATDEEDLIARIKEITAGKGARLTFDPVGGPTFEKLVDAAAPSGLLFLYGALSREATPLPLFNVLFKHLTVRGYTLFEITPDPALRQQGEEYIYRNLASGAFKPRIAKTFPLAEIVEAQRYMESNQQIGKIVVTV
jgi:NADPH:quinone reductase-like Zn-dependent oxidoreductase